MANDLDTSRQHYRVNQRVHIAPETVAMGFAAQGDIERFTLAETFQYLIRFDDGSCRKVHLAQIEGPA